MADIKTSLRELSVAVTVGLLARNSEFALEELYDCEKFFNFSKEIVKTNVPITQLSSIKEFTPEFRNIIKNGYALGEKIYNSTEFDIDENSEIIWKGNDTQKEDPVDIVIGKYYFSLKEDSFILENMGLYKLLNCFTGSTYKKRHIFKDYALGEYQNWFSNTWNEMINIIENRNGMWNYNNIQKQKEGVIKIQNDKIVFEYYLNKKLVSKCELPYNCSLETFEKITNSKTREEVFSKFIKKELSNNDTYNQAKKNCAIVATTNLANELRENLNYNAGLPRFLRIHEFDYYYAKTTFSEQLIYKVPSLDHFKDDIVIESIVSSVPDKQANILTTIRNKKTNQELVLRNECRFSHGQFNGTPEAKMYYEQGGSLLAIYEAI